MLACQPVFGELFDGAGAHRAATGVRDEYVDGSQPLLDLAAHALDVGVRRDVAGDGHAIGLCSRQRMLARVAATATSSRPWTATLAPAAANTRAICAPMPRELPVTSAVRPASALTTASREAIRG